MKQAIIDLAAAVKELAAAIKEGKEENSPTPQQRVRACARGAATTFYKIRKKGENILQQNR